MEDSFIKRLFTKPPILFPLAALFHIIISTSAIITLYPTPLSQRDWLRPLGMMVFSILSIFLCTMRKWSAMAYVALSIVCLALLYFSKVDSPEFIIGNSFFPFNIILSFFILLLFKRFK